MADAYLTLGVKKGCTREEVRAAFRAKAWQAHPDRGGDEQEFIELCSAYKKILKEVRSRPGEGRRTGVAQPSKTTDRTNPTRPEPSRKTDRHEVSSGPPHASWEPDLILAADVGRDGQPAPAPDPNWIPDLVVPDGPWSESRPEQPPDANWNPDVVLGDVSVEQGAGNHARDWLSATGTYRPLLQQTSERSSYRGETNWATICLKAILLFIFAVSLVVAQIACLNALNYDPDQAAREAARRRGGPVSHPVECRQSIDVEPLFFARALAMESKNRLSCLSLKYSSLSSSPKIDFEGAFAWQMRITLWESRGVAPARRSWLPSGPRPGRAHPDRGGDERAFIELCSAYKKILKVVPSCPDERRSARAARVTRPPKTPDQQESTGTYRAIFRRFSKRSTHERKTSWVTMCLKALLLFFFVVWLAVTPIACLNAWNYDPELAERKARRAAGLPALPSMDPRDIRR